MILKFTTLPVQVQVPAVAVVPVHVDETKLAVVVVPVQVDETKPAVVVIPVQVDKKSQLLLMYQYN